MWHRFSSVFSSRTKSLIQYDLLRMRTRLRCRKLREVPSTFLHLGCGGRRVPGWLNVDVHGSDMDIDITAPLPFSSGLFSDVVSQHVIEHLELKNELLPLLGELRRVMQPQGMLWLSCPDIEKICRSYIEHRMQDLYTDRRTRFPWFSYDGLPVSHLINDLFHQGGEHKNLFDFDILHWALTTAGFSAITRVSEADLLKQYPVFPERRDDAQSIYVSAQNA